MSAKARAALLLGAAALVAGGGAWLWQKFYSHKAQVEALHVACLAEFAESAAKMKAGTDPGAASSGVVKGLSESLGKALEGVSGGMGDAVCGALRDACRDDFEGRICVAARERYL